jgi:hypothetical protein
MFEKEEFSDWFKENTPKEGLSENTTFTRQFLIDAWNNGYRRGIEKMKKEACEFAVLKTTILKLRNCMNCKFRDIGGHSGCEDKAVILCNHWEMKE